MAALDAPVGLRQRERLERQPVVLHQRVFGEVVHRIHRIPGGFVRQWHGLCCLRDGAVLLDGFKQADAGVAEKMPGGCIHFQFAAQSVQ